MFMRMHFVRGGAAFPHQPSSPMKRRLYPLWAISLVALLTLTVTACGSASDTDAESATYAEAAVVESTPEIVPGTYRVDPAHTDVGFRIRHLGISSVDGRFSDVQGTVTFGESLGYLQAEATIQVNSIDSRNSERDEHLRSDEFFDAENHSTITFKSTNVQPLGGGRFRMTGDLTMKDVTRSIDLEGEYLGTVVDPSGRRVVAFTSETTIDRFDWDIDWNEPLGSGGFVVGETAHLTVNVEANR